MEPGCSIDFTRGFSLPFGVPPTLPAAQRTAYLGDLRLQTEFLTFRRPATGVDETDLDPISSTARRLRGVPRVAGGGEVLLPRTTQPPAPLRTMLEAREPTRAQIGTVGKDRWMPAAERPNRTLAQVAATTFRWDADAQKASVLPMPLVTEESLLLYWETAPAGSGLLNAPISGLLDATDSEYLLATSTTTRDGELDRRLIRAPQLGLVRFERYRHVLFRSPATLEVSHPSTAGALILKALPHGLVPPPAAPPLLMDNVLVFENIEVAAAIESLTGLVLCQILRFEEIVSLKKFSADLQRQLSWLLRSWLAYLKVVRPVHRPADPDPSPAIAAELRAPFEGRGHGTLQAVSSLLQAVRAAPAAWSSLVGYVRSFYAPALCGRSWAELGVDIPVAQAMRPAPLRTAHETLEHLPRSSETWLVCYAGCPLGRPAPAYVRSPAGLTPRDLAIGELSMFELEALLIAGRTTDVFPDVTPPALPDVLHPPDLAAFAAKSPGIFAVLRSIDRQPPKQEFTTRDWLSEVVKGANRVRPSDPQVDYAAFAAAAHPLAATVHWPLFEEAVAVRASLDALAAAHVGAQGLDAAILGWWVTKTGMADGGNWPVLIPREGPAELPPSPRDPYLDGATRPAGGVAGFDSLDIEAALLARRVVRDGKEIASTVPLPVFLALLDVEGYRSFTHQDRAQGAQNFLVIDDPAAPGGRRPFRQSDNAALTSRPGFLDTAALINWVLFPYGLDVFNQNVSFTPDAFVASSRASFTGHIDTVLRMEGLLPNEFAAAAAHRFAINRLRGRFRPPAGDVQNQRLSRRLQGLGMILQQAEFQKRHRALYLADQPGSIFERVEELVDPIPPQPGPNANSGDRREYIAYYSLIYLAFNVAPPTWNAWVRAADMNRPAAERVSSFLLYRTNAHPRTVEPTPPAAGPRTIFQRTNMIRFAVALDAYLRINIAGPPDTSDPAARIGW